MYTTTGRPVVYLGSTISQYYGNKFIFQDAFETTDIACLSVSGLRIGDSTIASYSLDTLGSCNILGQYKIAGTNVITGSGLGSGIVNASLNSVVPIGGSLLVSGHTNISPGSEYKINSVSVLSDTTLGSSVVSSSLTSLGTLTGLTVNGVMSLKSDTMMTDSNSNNRLYYESSAKLTINLADSVQWRNVANNTTFANLSSSGLDISSGSAYKINGTSVLTGTTLGSGVVGSSLTSVGTLGTLTVGTTARFNGAVVMPDGTFIYSSFGNKKIAFISEITNVYGDIHNFFSDATPLVVLAKLNSTGLSIGSTSLAAYKLDVLGDTNISSESVYRVNGTSVLSGNTLGSGIVNSSLTTVGALLGTSMASTLFLNDATSNGVFALYSTAGNRKMYLAGTFTGFYADYFEFRDNGSSNILANLTPSGLRLGTGGASSYQLHLTSDSAGKPTTSTWTIISDRNAKKNIVPMAGKSSDLIKQLNFNEFEYDTNHPAIDNGITGKCIGFITDEIVEIDGLADCVSCKVHLGVSGESDTEFHDLQLHSIFIHGLKPTQELIERIEKLEALIEAKEPATELEPVEPVVPQVPPAFNNMGYYRY